MMMSVLIKGMEMPKRCLDCKCLWFALGCLEYRCCITNKAFFTMEEIAEKRREDCPLEEIKDE